MSVWTGLENGMPTAEMRPREFAPTNQQQLNWPMWGQYYETEGAPASRSIFPRPPSLMRLYRAWGVAASAEEKTRIWHEMLHVRAEQLFTIGVVRAVPQPVVVSNRLRNVPEEGVFNWEPGAYFGVYHPEAFWFADPGDNPSNPPAR